MTLKKLSRRLGIGTARTRTATTIKLFVVKIADDKEGCACFGVEFALRVEDFAFADHSFAPVVKNFCLRENSRRIRHDRVHKFYVQRDCHDFFI